MSQHKTRLASAAWAKRVVDANGRAVLVFSQAARPLAALIVTASDKQLAALVESDTLPLSVQALQSSPAESTRLATA